MALNQATFRGRNDDGSEAAATWKAALNTNWTQGVDQNFRVRIEATEDASKNEEDGAQFQYNKNAAGWNDVNATSANVRSFASANFAEGDDTTQQLGAGAFVSPNEGMDEVNGFGNEGLNRSKADSIEYEFCVQIRGVDVANNDTIQFRLVRGAGAGVFETYTQTPTVTVSAAPPNQTVTPLANAAILAIVAITTVAGAVTLTPSATVAVSSGTVSSVTNNQAANPSPVVAVAISPAITAIAGALTVTPAPVAMVSSATVPTVMNDVTLLPAANTAAATIPVIAVTNGNTLTPGVNASAATSPDVVATIGALTVTPAVIASNSSITTPVVMNDFTLLPAVNSSAATSPAIAVMNGNTLTPGVNVSAATTPDVVAIAGGLTVTPAAMAAISTAAIPTITSDSTVAPVAATSQASIPAPFVTNSVTLSPGVVSALSSVTSPAVTAGVVVVASTPGTMSSSAATVSITNAVVVSPAAVVAVVSAVQPTVTNDVVLAPDAVSAAISQPVHAVSLSAETILTPTFLSVNLEATVPILLPGQILLAPGTVTAAMTAAAVTASTTDITITPAATVAVMQVATVITSVAVRSDAAFAVVSSPDVSVVAGQATATPTAVVATMTAAVPVAGNVQTVSPSPATVATTTIDAVVLPGLITITPDPSTATVSTPDPTAVSVVTLTPSSVAAAATSTSITVTSQISVAPAVVVAVSGAVSVSVSSGPTVALVSPVAITASVAPTFTVKGAAIAQPSASSMVISAVSVTQDSGQKTVTPSVVSLAATAPSVALFLGDAPVVVVTAPAVSAGVRPLAQGRSSTVGKFQIADTISASIGRFAAMGAAGKLVSVPNAIGDSVLGLICGVQPSASGPNVAVVRSGDFFIASGNIVGALPGCRIYTSDGVSVHTVKATGDLFVGTFVSSSGAFSLINVSPTEGFVPPVFADNSSIGQAVSKPVSVSAATYAGGSSFVGVSGEGTVTIDGSASMVLSSLATGASSGVSGAGSTPTSIVKPISAANWTSSDLVNSFVKITSGAAVGAITPVQANNTTTITVLAISGFAAGDTFDVVSCGIDLGIVTVSACTAPFVFKGCKIERLISTGNFSVTVDACCFDTPHASGSLLSERDSLIKAKDCLVLANSSIKINRATETSVPGLTLQSATFAVKGGFVSGDIFATGGGSTPISFTDCWKVECGCNSGGNSGGSDGVHIDSSSFAVSGVGLIGSGNLGYGLRVDGVSSRVDVTGATITGTTGDIIVGSTAKTWAQLALDGGVMDSGAYAGVGSGLSLAGNVQVLTGQFTVNSNFNQSGRMLTFGFQHDSPTPSELSLVASAGGGQANATQLNTTPVSVVGTVAAIADSIKLVSNHAGLGARKEVVNNGVNSMTLYPSLGHKINGILNVGFAIAPGTRAVCTAISATEWAVTS